MLEENMDKLHAVAKALIEFEKLDANEFEAAFSGVPLNEVKNSSVSVKSDEKVNEIHSALNDGTVRKHMSQENASDDDTTENNHKKTEE